MGSVGDAYDNATCESFFATLECELLARSRFKAPAEARRAVFDFIEGFRHNAHLAMLLKRTDFVGRRPVMWGVLGGSWPAGRGRGRQCCRDQHG